jgi:glycosyltransferase involved in cell wall biosynthesis
MVERASAAFADHVILANHLWLEKYASRSTVPGKCSVFINHVDPNIFQPLQRKREDGKLVVLFPGGLQWHQGIDIAIRAFKKICQKLPQAEFHIYGDGNMKSQLVKLAQDLDLNDKVRFFEPLRIRQIAHVMADADLGVVPKRADSFGNEAYSTKIMEFMSVGVPVIVSNTKIDRYYFDDSMVRFFESGNSEKLSEVMFEVLCSMELRQRMVSQAHEYVARNSWDVRKSDYLDLVDSLCQTHGG